MEIESPSTPALDAARAEMKEVATNPQNPRYAGYQRGDKQVMDYLDEVYKKAVPDSVPVPLRHESLSARTGGPDDQAPALSPEDTEAFEALRHEWGDQYHEHHADAQFGMSRITRAFGGEADDLTAAVLAAGGDLKLVMNIARHFGKAARGYAP